MFKELWPSDYNYFVLLSTSWWLTLMLIGQAVRKLVILRHYDRVLSLPRWKHHFLVFKTQPTVFRSSAEAEYKNIANAVAEICWIRNPSTWTTVSQATIVYCDNTSSVYMSNNPVQHQHTKHIEIDIHFRQKIAMGQVKVLHVPSSLQYTDIFTNSLPTTLLKDFQGNLTVKSVDCGRVKEYGLFLFHIRDFVVKIYMPYS